MIDLLIIGGLAALVSHAKNQSYEGKVEKLQQDLMSGRINPQQAQSKYSEIVQTEIDKIPSQGMTLPPNIKQAFESGLDYKQLAGKVDPDTYNFLEQAYWYGDWDCSKKNSKNKQ
ncbi:hypothetical protein ACX27_04085 [Nostoc piscinale CENA21]|uniref:Uncharacterized protein n=1 Tax=Nostoc piscinale CENA21 TaxID=224013 RepID=A0A0M4SP38_9NOSO|nr:hypothetical protein [Nostoc piscinale]ALF52215.1 hypothetical protein ACX27_04085 [Nostoc piscinale CENA21]